MDTSYGAAQAVIVPDARRTLTDCSCTLILISSFMPTIPSVSSKRFTTIEHGSGVKRLKTLTKAQVQHEKSTEVTDLNKTPRYLDLLMDDDSNDIHYDDQDGDTILYSIKDLVEDGEMGLPISNAGGEWEDIEVLLNVTGPQSKYDPLPFQFH
jgi:hypothetical protein